MQIWLELHGRLLDPNCKKNGLNFIVTRCFMLSNSILLLQLLYLVREIMQMLKYNYLLAILHFMSVFLIYNLEYFLLQQ